MTSEVGFRQNSRQYYYTRKFLDVGCERNRGVKRFRARTTGRMALTEVRKIVGITCLETRHIVFEMVTRHLNGARIDNWT